MRGWLRLNEPDSLLRASLKRSKLPTDELNVSAPNWARVFWVKRGNVIILDVGTEPLGVMREPATAAK